MRGEYEVCQKHGLNKAHRICSSFSDILNTLVDLWRCSGSINNSKGVLQFRPQESTSFVP